jgi:VanZ family protein
MKFISNHNRARLRWIPALFFAVVIFMFSNIPGNEVKKSFDNLNTTVQVVSSAGPEKPVLSPAIDWLKVAHGVGYFWLGITVLYALTTQSRWSLLRALLLCSLYAVTDEFHQSFVSSRTASARDVLIDSFAALAGIITILGIKKVQAIFNSKRRPIQN